MPENRRKFDRDFKDGAVRVVLESGRPVAEIARELGVHEGTLGNWVNTARAQQRPGALSESERNELNRLRKENAELRMQRDVLKRSVVLWVDEATGRKS
jgi:transposase